MLKLIEEKKFLDQIENKIPYTEEDFKKIALKVTYSEGKFSIELNSISLMINNDVRLESQIFNDIKKYIPNITYIYGKYFFPTSLSTGYNITNQKAYMLIENIGNTRLNLKNKLLLLQMMLSTVSIYEYTKHIPDINSARMKKLDKPRYLEYKCYRETYKIYSEYMIYYTSYYLSEHNYSKQNIDKMIAILK